jgi:5-phospho-D-xylono-1,4-lactonase
MSAQSPSLMVMTVRGPLAPHALGATDAHNHAWIDPVPGGDPGAPILNQEEALRSELAAYRRAGGGALVDCQPGGCGRDGRRLLALSKASGVSIVACTGFHRRRYYPPGHDLWALTAQGVADRFGAELTQGLVETRELAAPARAGYVKAACEARLVDSALAALEGAVAAAAASGAALMVHTEKGADAGALLEFVMAHGLSPERLVIFHIDKRPDFGLHRELAQAGVLLEYDTFYRPRYEPEINLWPLIARMVEAGLENRVALGTDMAEAAMWRSLGGAPGLEGLLTVIRPRLQALGLSQESIARLLGGNIAERLALPTP